MEAEMNTYALQPCPVCNADPQYRIWSKFVNSSYTHVLSEKHKIVGSAPRPLVCTRCGFVQLFVNPEDFRSEEGTL